MLFTVSITVDRQDQGLQPSEWIPERQQVLDAARAMHDDGLVSGTSGNVSARCVDSEATSPGARASGAGAENTSARDGLMAITPSSKGYETLTLDDIVVVDFEGDPVVGDSIPSTELLMHAAIYRARPDAGAVMHTHSVYASALAVSGVPLPAIVDEMIITLGDSVQVSNYAFPSSEELGKNVVSALGERNAALIRNHGLVGVGRNANAALAVCRLAERLAHIYMVASVIGTPQVLPADAVASELELFRMRQGMERFS